MQRPLVLLVAAGRAERELRLAVAQRERRATASCAAACRGASEAGRPSSSQNICARVPSGQPSPGITGELCSQPPLGVAETRLPKRSATSRWHGVAARRRLAPARRRRRVAARPATSAGSRPAARARSSRGRVARRRARAARRCTSRREQPLERHVGEGRVAVARLAVGERELRALDDRVDVARRPDRASARSKPVEQRELLQEDRPLAPRRRSCRPSARGSRTSTGGSTRRRATPARSSPRQAAPPLVARRSRRSPRRRSRVEDASRARSISSSRPPPPRLVERCAGRSRRARGLRNSVPGLRARGR